MFQVSSIVSDILPKSSSFTKALSDQLQSVSNDMARAADLVQGTIKTLTDMRNDKAYRITFTNTPKI